jgi:ABC-2 type transport system permease protein
VFALFKKELATFFSSQIAFISIGLFLSISGILLWIFPDYSILVAGYASMQTFFELAPYLFLFLIPAISMRSLAEERKDGTDELLRTQPLSVFEIIGAKYLAVCFICLLSLLPTLFYVFTIDQLGTERDNLDFGGTFGAYLGLFLIAATWAAIGIFASSITKNQVSAFLLTAGLAFCLFVGFDSLSNWPLFNEVTNILQDLGMQRHYQSMSRGVLLSNDVFYFLDIILVFLLLASYQLDKRLTSAIKSNKKFKVFILAFIALHLLSTLCPIRYDFTAEKRYTLSETSINAVRKLQSPLQVNIYLSGELPSGFRQLSQASRDLLKDLEVEAEQPIQVSFINPNEGNALEREKTLQLLYEQGIQPTNLSVKTEEGITQKLIFPKAQLAYQGKKIVVDLLQSRMGASPATVLNQSIENLEYAFISAINQLLKSEKPRIGFTEGHGELNDVELSDAMSSLETGFTVGRVDLQQISRAGLDQIAILVIAKPLQAFSELEKFKLDHFIRQGGRLLMAIDQSNANLDSLRENGTQLATANKLNLDDLLFKYGVRLNYHLLADMNCAQIPLNVGDFGGAAQVQLLPWLFYPVIMPNTDHPMVKNLEGIRAEFAGSIDTLAVKGVKKTILLSSSPYNKTMDLPAMVSLQMLEESPDPASLKGNSKPFAVLLEGEFNSVFKNRPLPEALDPDFKLNAGIKSGKLLVVADGDLLKNQQDQDGAPYPLGYDRFTQQVYGNKAFLLNAVDYLLNDAELIALRNKEYKLRMLDRAKIQNEKFFWQAFNILLPLILLAIFGFFQHWYRKRKYTV